MLSGTDYLLEGKPAERVLADLHDLDVKVRALRSSGRLDDGTLDRLRSEWKIEQVYETTGIEGSTLDLNETRLVVQRGLTIAGKPSKDSQDARNMAAALDYLEEEARSDLVLRPTTLRKIQQLVIGDDPGAGVFRSRDVVISGSTHSPPPPSVVPAQIDQAFAWLAQAEDCPAPLRAAVMHAWIAHLHPFIDGNGRTSRAVTNLILIGAGYPIALIRRKDRNRYYDALAASDNGDIAPLVDLIVQRAQDSIRQIVRAQEAATGLTQAVRLAEERARFAYESWRQAMLLLLRSIDDAADRAGRDSEGAIWLHLREYDQVTVDDYLALLRDDVSGNGWLAILRGTGYGHESSLLIWVGFRSSLFRSDRRAPDHGASLYFSEPDPTGGHPFRQLTDQSGFRIQEVGFDGGQFWIREGGQERLRPVTVDVLANRIVREFIEQFLG